MALSIKNQVLIRTYAVTGGLVLMAMFIFIKAVTLSVVEGKKWREQGANQYIKKQPLPGERGNILAADGSLLATSLPIYEIAMDCASATIAEDKFKAGIDSLGWYLATYVDNQYTAGAWSKFIFDMRYTYKSHYVVIKKDAPYDLVQFMRTFPIFREGQFKGGFIEKRGSRREHPFKMLAQRTLGYARTDIKLGIEGAFDRILSSGDDSVLMQKVGKDVWLPVVDLAAIEPKNGDDVLTTLDVNIQDITQTALIRSLDYHQAEFGTAIVMEVKTGKIKAISNVGKGMDGKWWETFNYGIGYASEPGSIFKLASIMAMMEDDAIRLTDTININRGIMQFYDRTMVDHERTDVVYTTVQKAFALSSNVGMARLTDSIYHDKPEAYLKHLRDFNLANIANIEIEGEAPPKIKDSKSPTWSGVSLPWMSIGYELNITPLQMLTFYNAVANDGVLMKPYIVSEIQHYGETIQQFKPVIVKKRIAKKETIDQAKVLLESVVSFGTASALKTDKYRFAGKTGTAQLDYEKTSANKKTTVGGYQASFVGYFPAENPIFSCIVVISKPKANGYYGGLVAGPVFREIADRCVASNVQLAETVNAKGKPMLPVAQMPDDVGYQRDVQKVLTHLGLKNMPPNVDGDWTFLRARNDTVFTIARQMGAKTVIPSVVGMGLKDAVYVLENRGLRVRFSGYGKVVSQSIASGVKAMGQEIYIKLE